MTEAPVAPVDAPPPSTPSHTERGLRRLVNRLRPVLPWLSLLTSVLSGTLMNRAPDRAWIVVLATAAGWIFLALLALFGATLDTRASSSRTAQRARFALFFGGQLALQQALLFPLPFYARAAVPVPGHFAFFALYGAALVVVLWDPLFYVVMRRSGSKLALQAGAAFAGLLTVLPIVGIDHRRALLLTSAITATGVAAFFFGHRRTDVPRAQRGTPRVAAEALVLGVGLFILLQAGAAFIPPAPYERAQVAFGTRVVDHALVDPQTTVAAPTELLCHSAVAAPLGLSDALVHVWRRNGAPVDRVSLNVSGGRKGGFRTWSKKTNPAGLPAGRYTCTVETAAGQVLGEAAVRVTAAAAPAALAPADDATPR